MNDSMIHSGKATQNKNECLNVSVTFNG